MRDKLHVFIFFLGNHLKFVVVVLNTWNLNLDTLTLPHLLDNLTGFGSPVKNRTTRKNGPVVKDGLGEGLSTSVGTEIGSETERLVDGKVSLNVEQRSSGTLLLREDVSSSPGQDTVDTTHSLLRNLDLDKVDRLQKTRVGKKGCGVEHTTGSRDDLSTTTVNSISVEGNIHDVETDAAHGLLSNGSLTGGPLETGNNGILDFVQVLDSLGLVNQQVGTVCKC